MATTAYSFQVVDKEPQHFDFYDDLFEQYIDADHFDFANDYFSDRTSTSDFGNYFDFPDSLSGTNPNDSPLQGSFQLGSCPKASLSEPDLLNILDPFAPAKHASGPSPSRNPSCPPSPAFDLFAGNDQFIVRRSASCGVHKRRSVSPKMSHPRASRHGSKHRMMKLEASASTYGVHDSRFEGQLSPRQDAGNASIQNTTAYNGWDQQISAQSDMSSHSSMCIAGPTMTPLASPTMDLYTSHRSSMVHSPIGFDAFGSQDGSYALASPFQDRVPSWGFDQPDLYSDSSAGQYWWPQTNPEQPALPGYEQRYSMQAMGGTCPEDAMLPQFNDQMLLEDCGMPIGYSMVPAAVPMPASSYTTSTPLYSPSYSVTQDHLPVSKRHNSHPQQHSAGESRSPSPHVSTPRTSQHSSSHKPSREHRRGKSSVSSSHGRASSSSASGSAAIAFHNMTPEHSKQILKGVAPSGSSKTKARREREAAESLRKAVLDSVLESGGDISALEGSYF